MLVQASSGGNLIGIDTSQIIKTFTNGTSGAATEKWNATEDCYVCGRLTYTSSMGNQQAYARLADTEAAFDNYTAINVGDAYLAGIASGASFYSDICFPVKKGQWVKICNMYNSMTDIKAYKIK